MTRPVAPVEEVLARLLAGEHSNQARAIVEARRELASPACLLQLVGVALIGAPAGTPLATALAHAHRELREAAPKGAAS